MTSSPWTPVVVVVPEPPTAHLQFGEYGPSSRAAGSCAAPHPCTLTDQQSATPQTLTSTVQNGAGHDQEGEGDNNRLTVSI